MKINHLVLSLMSALAIAFGWYVSNISAKVDNHERRVSTVEQAVLDMKTDLHDIKDAILGEK